MKKHFKSIIIVILGFSLLLSSFILYKNMNTKDDADNNSNEKEDAKYILKDATTFDICLLNYNSYNEKTKHDLSIDDRQITIYLPNCFIENNNIESDNKVIKSFINEEKDGIFNIFIKELPMDLISSSMEYDFKVDDNYPPSSVSINTIELKSGTNAKVLYASGMKDDEVINNYIYFYYPLALDRTLVVEYEFLNNGLDYLFVTNFIDSIILS